MAIVLAAGGSRRFGRGDKLLARLGGQAVIGHAMARARRWSRGRLLVVVPSRGGRVGRAVRWIGGRGATAVVAREHARGMGASLLAGLAAIRPIERELAIFLGDMPCAAPPRRLRLRPGEDAVRPIAAGRPGHPLLVRAGAARAAGLQADDRGLAARLDRRRVASVRGTPGNLLDIDTPAMLRRARRLWRSLR